MTTTGLRERKKLDTHREIIRCARALVQEYGVDQVTVEEIADAAGVSPRTFFNYFSSKEEAVVAPDPVVLIALAEELRTRPASEGPVAALRAVLIGRGDPDATLARWQLRQEWIAANPKLLPRYLAGTAQIEEVLTNALAARAGLDPARDHRPRALVAAVLAATRTSVAWWHASNRRRSLRAVLDATFLSLRSLDFD